MTLAQGRTKQKAGSHYEPFIKDDAKELCEALCGIRRIEARTSSLKTSYDTFITSRNK